MDTPLYKLYLYKRSPSYYETSPERVAVVRRKLQETQQALGIRDLFNANMAWSNEKYETFGVEFYPNLAALHEFTRCQVETGFYRYVQSESYIGIPMDNTFPDFEVEPVERPVIGPEQAWEEPEGQRRHQSPVYRVYLSRPAAGAHMIPEHERNSMLARTQENAALAGVRPLLSAYMRWNQEQWEYFGIERFPDMETLISYTQFLSEVGWYRLTESCSYLGAAYSGLISGV